ncbi:MULTISPECIES: LCP family protein [Streptosporangium]|uniref:LCP family protein required for cell wall assembly n=1 Tax=Streptosporangium brasiliense TaxID=47480 RepID=A0ABT9R0P1_9ACTN|nr:LCP family protein [Streptosporangium brasiliense]MDP9862797.1 LCP family protein required for cell wall assembly [Streptosporangium brasiliense]
MSDHRHVSVKDRRAEPAGHGRRGSRRAGGDGGPPPEPPSDYAGPPRDPRRKAGRLGVGGWVSIAMTGVLVAGTLGGYKFYRDLDDSITRESVVDKLGANRPPETGALNVLVVGSDTRDGAGNKRYGQHMQGQGERTDTIILLHISPNRDKATLVSFPRDSMVQVPACENPVTKAAIPAGLKQINSAFNDGGIVCTWKTIEALTQIHVDHFVKVDFAGFTNIVDALGGIEICLPEDVMDKKAKLELTKGKHNVMGKTALAYVRARYALGDGSDLSRIKRQQVFLQQVMKKATSSDLLTDLGKLNNFLKAAASSVTMDSNLDTGRLLEIAQSAKSLTSSGLKAITVPWMPDPADKNRVVWRQPAATELFDAIRSDTEVTKSPVPNASAKPAVKHEQVQVQVFNGTGTYGLAKEVAAKLADQGFRVTQVGNARPATGDVPTTVLRYGKRDAEGASYADALAARLSGDKLTPVAGKVKPASMENYAATIPATPLPTGPVVQLIIGTDWKGVRVPTKIPDSLKDSVVDSKTNPCQ